MEKAIVVGGSVAGLLAAAGLARAGREVVVLERDPDPGPHPRPGVPQGNQPHVYLRRGLQAIDELLPGMTEDLQAAGAVPFDTGELAWLGEQGWNPIRAAFDVLSVSRPVFEDQVRRRVRGLPGVDCRFGTRVTGLQHTDGWSVTCRTENEEWSEPAELVVDASGRSSRLPHWLQELGLSTPAEEVVDAHLGYASFDLVPSPELAGLPGMVVTTTVADPRGGLALAVEGGRWVVAVVGMGDDRPDRDLATVRSFLSDLRDPAMAAFVDAGRVQGDVRIHRQTRNQRRRYERLRNWPPGLLVVGDAACAFDPIYGQGIAVAALQAMTLHQAFSSEFDLSRTRLLQRRLSRAADLPWDVATSQDLRYRSSDGELRGVPKLVDTWVRHVGLLGVHGNGRAIDTLAGVYHLMTDPRRLFHPALMAAAVRARIRGLGPATERPDALPAISQ